MLAKIPFVRRDYGGRYTRRADNTQARPDQTRHRAQAVSTNGIRNLSAPDYLPIEVDPMNALND